MAKFKKGDRVRYSQDGECIKARGKICIIDSVSSAFPSYHTEDDTHTCASNESNFELIEQATTYKVGDVLVDSNDDEFTVLAVLNQGVGVYLLSRSYRPTIAGIWWTTSEIKSWKLKEASDNAQVEKSVAEIEKELGIESGKLRIKKDQV